MRWHVEHTGSTMAGGVEFTDRGVSITGRGSVTGTVTEGTLQFTLTVSAGGFDVPYDTCTTTVTGQASAGATSLTGTYTGTSSGSGDGVLGNWGMNNFYTYRFPDTTTFALLPWDKSDAFIAGPYASVWHNITDVPPSQQNRLVNRALGYEDLQRVWLDALESCVNTSLEPDLDLPAEGGWLSREVERQYAQIRAAALADPVAPYTDEQFEQAIADLKTFSRERPAFVAAEVAAARAALGLSVPQSSR